MLNTSLPRYSGSPQGMTGTQHQPGGEIRCYEFSLSYMVTQQTWHNFEEISHDETDPVCHPVHLNGDPSRTGEGKLDEAAAL